MIHDRLVFHNNSLSFEVLIRTIGTTLASVILIGALAVVAPLPGIARNAVASGAAIPSCSTSGVKEVTSTNSRIYGPGTMVVMTSSLRNTSSSVCNVAVGPTSPTITVTNSRGDVVWNNCYMNDQHRACALYLVEHTLNPGATYEKTVSWDQRTGEPLARVPAGAYHLIAQFSALPAVHATTFQLATVTSPRTITVTQANSGQSISLHVGGRLYVQLAGPAIYTWTEPISSNAVVLVRATGSSGAVAAATFLAQSTGHVRVSAVDNPDCYPECLSPSRLFEVAISVVS